MRYLDKRRPAKSYDPWETAREKDIRERREQRRKVRNAIAGTLLMRASGYGIGSLVHNAKGEEQYQANLAAHTLELQIDNDHPSAPSAMIPSRSGTGMPTPGNGSSSVTTEIGDSVPTASVVESAPHREPTKIEEMQQEVRDNLLSGGTFLFETSGESGSSQTMVQLSNLDIDIEPTVQLESYYAELQNSIFGYWKREEDGFEFYDITGAQIADQLQLLSLSENASILYGDMNPASGEDRALQILSQYYKGIVGTNLNAVNEYGVDSKILDFWRKYMIEPFTTPGQPNIYMIDYSIYMENLVVEGTNGTYLDWGMFLQNLDSYQNEDKLMILERFRAQLHSQNESLWEAMLRDEGAKLVGIAGLVDTTNYYGYNLDTYLAEHNAVVTNETVAVPASLSPSIGSTATETTATLNNVPK